MKTTSTIRAKFYERQEVNKANALGCCDLPRPSVSYKRGWDDALKLAIIIVKECSAIRDSFADDEEMVNYFLEEFGE